ncbi:hypothetical protein E6C76_20150 [Pseudothauera nasutitermitis]|uniref:Minor tail protein n=1 Tax=Pseudothauera nasutitermitis TaxID=2565930 RepID=A0A4S4AQE7_9RHOO|nr:hypothetical protein [Pseudothauera nasutitermitis]THF61397.1 hypothetical protein E6C76_20150 [Pseudothauera nasutitermitis]
MKRGLTITGLGQLKRATARLRTVAEISERAGYRATNAVLGKLETQVKRDIGSHLNLPQSYLREQMRTTKAGPSNNVAYIRMRIRAVRLARFDARQITAETARAKGDPRRGIPAGRKAAGVSVKVMRRGGRKTMPGAFMLPLRAGKIGSGNGMGIFVREGSNAALRAERLGFKVGESGRNTPVNSTRRKGGSGRLRHLYGPSPDQLFRRWRGEAVPEIKTMLAQAYASQLRYELRGTRK